MINGSIAAIFPSPTPTPTPTQTTTPTPICTGSASWPIKQSSQKSLTEEDSVAKIKENLKGDLKKLNENQQFKDFLDCKYPPTFTCPSNCKVDWAFHDPQISITPESISNSNTVLKQCTYPGEIKIFFGALDLIPGVGINTAAGAITNELMKVAKEAAKKCPCPAGSSQQIDIIIVDKKVETGWFGALPPKYGTMVTVKYRVEIKCIQTQQTTSSSSKLEYSTTITKSCVNK